MVDLFKHQELYCIHRCTSNSKCLSLAIELVCERNYMIVSICFHLTSALVLCRQ